MKRENVDVDKNALNLLVEGLKEVDLNKVDKLLTPYENQNKKNMDVDKNHLFSSPSIPMNDLKNIS